MASVGQAFQPDTSRQAVQSQAGKPDLLVGIFGSLYVFDKFDSQTQRETVARRGSEGRFAEKNELATDQHG
jgi:hypothetical protein